MNRLPLFNPIGSYLHLCLNETTGVRFDTGKSTLKFACKDRCFEIQFQLFKHRIHHSGLDDRYYSCRNHGWTGCETLYPSFTQYYRWYRSKGQVEWSPCRE